MQFWTETNPCAYCGAYSNTSHKKSCRFHGIHDKDGRILPLETEQYQLELNLEIP